ncbi:uncharacterized protein LOC125479247 [Pyrus x bretschneideri]|uniref:uncharacterized protein LOC125479247 n=1 Tax=Pyrus x bretschneideri TaxID=225117 RepID=UPI002030D41F|nr:uncharacterized protein LOC125479247 [Pyrus x bretschneideri]
MQNSMHQRKKNSPQADPNLKDICNTVPEFNNFGSCWLSQLETCQSYLNIEFIIRERKLTLSFTTQTPVFDFGKAYAVVLLTHHLSAIITRTRICPSSSELIRKIKAKPGRTENEFLLQSVKENTAIRHRCVVNLCFAFAFGTRRRRCSESVAGNRRQGSGQAPPKFVLESNQVDPDPNAPTLQSQRHHLPSPRLRQLSPARFDGGPVPVIRRLHASAAVVDVQRGTDYLGNGVITRHKCLFAVDKQHEHGHKFAVWYPVDTGLFVTGSYDHHINVWDTNTTQVLMDFKMPGKVYGTAMSPLATSHMLVAAGTEDVQVRLCDITSLGLLLTPCLATAGGQSRMLDDCGMVYS